MAPDADDGLDLQWFHDNDFGRRTCAACGNLFWSQDPERETCGDAPCVEYGFIGAPVTSEELTLPEMRERFLSFFEARGHGRVDRRPVVARWRDDIYLAIASIAVFQPHVTGGDSAPPANPLTLSQPSIRLNDVDSVGKSGRHLTTFEMMTHTVFNYPDEHYYYKDRTVELCQEFLVSLGMPSDAITYKENPWSGGGNAGAALEVLVGGLEVATLVFMDLEADPDGPIEVKGERFRQMDMQIVDTGYGLERLVWASNGAPTIYDAIYPDVVAHLVSSAGLEETVGAPRTREILAEVARLSSILDVDTGQKLLDLRKRVHERLVASHPDLTFEEMVTILQPLEAVYAVADHTRSLAFMLGDGIVPSNVKAGYLARLLIRRTLRLMESLGLPETLAELIDLQLRKLQGDFPELREKRDVVLQMAELETERYRETLQKGARLVRRTARALGNGHVPLDQLVAFYDTHGIPPEIVQNVAAEEGVTVEIPDDFYAQVADRHAGEGRGAGGDDGDADLRKRIQRLPVTKPLYYDSAWTREFEAVVQWAEDDLVVLNQTAFYPEGGGQPADRGHLVSEDGSFDVVDVQKLDGVIIHRIAGEVPPTGTLVSGRIDWGRRVSLMRNHTATHIVIASARRVLGPHIWQAGAQKGTDHSRIDISHFRRVEDEELREIEQLANLVVLDDLAVEKVWMSREEAESTYGMQLYQGGVPKGDRVRVVRIPGFDVEFCGGTHVRQTSDVGLIKILGTERVQDGVERLHFTAGMAAVREVQRRDQLLDAASDVFRVSFDDLPRTAERFFEEWKEQRKEIEGLRHEVAEARTRILDSEDVGGVAVVFRFPEDDGASVEDLFAELTTYVNEGPDRLAIGATPAGDAVVVASEGSDLDAPAIFGALREALGGRGGGRGSLARGRLEKVEPEAARRAVLAELQGE